MIDSYQIYLPFIYHCTESCCGQDTSRKKLVLPSFAVVVNGFKYMGICKKIN